MNGASPGQVMAVVVIVCVVAVMLTRTIGDFILMFRDVIERFKRYRWEASLWRDVGKSLEADRRAIRTRRLRKV